MKRDASRQPPISAILKRPAARVPLSAAILAASSVLATGCASKVVTADAVYFPPPPAPAHVVHLKSFNRLADLVPRRPTLADVFRGGSVSPYVSKPAGVAYRDGHLYICDTGLGVVHDWDLASGVAGRLGQSGETVLKEPVAVCVDDQGMVFVADRGRGEVVGFDSAGNEGLRFKPQDGGEYKPVAVAVRQGRLYVADLAGLLIDVFSTEDATRLSSFTAGSAPGSQALPIGLAVDDSGHVYVTDLIGGRVLVFGQDHAFIRAIGQRGDRYGDLGQPRHLHLFNSEGQLLMLAGSPEDRPGGTPMPVGSAVAPALPDRLASLVPTDFAARYYLFMTNGFGSKRISLFAVGESR